MRRLTVFLFLVMLLGCTAQQPSGSTVSTPTVAPATPTVAPATPRPNAGFSGPLEAVPWVSGTISFVISESGQIAEMKLELGRTTFDCGGGKTITVGGGISTYFFPKPIAIQAGRFSTSSGQLDWDGMFDSATSVRGTIRISGGTDCQNRPPSVTWSATSEGS